MSLLVNHANQHPNLVNTLGVTQCDAGSPLQTLSYALLHLFRYTFSQTLYGILYFKQLIVNAYCFVFQRYAILKDTSHVSFSDSFLLLLILWEMSVEFSDTINTALQAKLIEFPRNH